MLVISSNAVPVPQVEKTEEADQEIKQDGTKPEDKAHKAATKIQASFRGHIIRKKMKDDDKEEDSPAAEAKAEDNEGEKKEEKATSPTVDKQDEAAKEEEKAKSPTNSPAAEESKAEAPATSPSEPKKDVKEEPKEAEKPKEAESADVEAEKPSENVDAEKKEEGNEEEKKAEAKQADVPVTASETADCEAEVNQTQDKPGELRQDVKDVQY